MLLEIVSRACLETSVKLLISVGDPVQVSARVSSEDLLPDNISSGTPQQQPGEKEDEKEQDENKVLLGCTLPFSADSALLEVWAKWLHFS